MREIAVGDIVCCRARQRSDEWGNWFVSSPDVSDMMYVFLIVKKPTTDPSLIATDRGMLVFFKDTIYEIFT